MPQKWANFDGTASPLEWPPSGHLKALTSFKWRIISSFSWLHQSVCSCGYKAVINYTKFIFSRHFLTYREKKKCDNPCLSSWMTDFPFLKFFFNNTVWYTLLYFHKATASIQQLLLRSSGVLKLIVV